MLSDGTLRNRLAVGSIIIDPAPTDDQIQPASIDVRLGSKFLTFSTATAYIDPLDPVDMSHAHIKHGDSFILHAGQFVLGSTIERVSLPTDVVARIEGKSSLGRLGLLVHATAGFVDPGFSGNLTLEMFNVTRHPIILWPGMRIAQLAFDVLDRHVQRPYGHPDLRSRYQGQTDPTPSMAFRG